MVGTITITTEGSQNEYTSFIIKTEENTTSQNSNYVVQNETTANQPTEQIMDYTGKDIP